jgi:uncharacterized protein
MSISKPSHAEEEYFAREEAEKRRKLALQSMQALGEDERKRLRKAHHMRCPKCGLELQEIAFRGVLVDRCFSCHGVFLDESDINALLGNPGYWESIFQFFSRKDYGASE